jgi:hypothetical protein
MRCSYAWQEGASDSRSLEVDGVGPEDLFYYQAFVGLLAPSEALRPVFMPLFRVLRRRLLYFRVREKYGATLHRPRIFETRRAEPPFRQYSPSLPEDSDKRFSEPNAGIDPGRGAILVFGGTWKTDSPRLDHSVSILQMGFDLP